GARTRRVRVRGRGSPQTTGSGSVLGAGSCSVGRRGGETGEPKRADGLTGRGRVRVGRSVDRRIDVPAGARVGGRAGRASARGRRRSRAQRGGDVVRGCRGRSPICRHSRSAAGVWIGSLLASSGTSARRIISGLLLAFRICGPGHMVVEYARERGG